jgi:hypothetical protein
MKKTNMDKILKTLKAYGLKAKNWAVSNAKFTFLSLKKTYVKMSAKQRLIAGAVLLIILSAGGWYAKKNLFKPPLPKKVYEIAVQVRSQENSDPVEDMRTSMKAGDVIVVQDEGHSWSNTEKVSYLILKMSLDEEQKAKLTSPEERDQTRKEKEARKPKDFDKMPKEERKRFENEMEGRGQKVTVRTRKYRIDLEELNFTDPNTLLSAQPYPDKIFDWGIVEEK